MIALDTNVLVYAEADGGDRRAAQARLLVASLVRHELFIPAQCLGELFRVLTGKARWEPVRAIRAVDGWRALAAILPTTEAVAVEAMAIHRDHDHQIWDAIILAAAAQADCVLLLSEDMQDGFVYRGVTVANPFAERIHPLLASLMDSLSPSRPAGAPE